MISGSHHFEKKLLITDRHWQRATDPLDLFCLKCNYEIDMIYIQFYLLYICYAYYARDFTL